MTKQPTKADLASAYAEIDPLCIKVGLTRAEPPRRLTDNVDTPEGTALWTSAYAQLLLWPCSASNMNAIENAASTAQCWFDEVLNASEGRAHKRTTDGYLVLALPSAPGEDAREEIRRLELSTQVCRKHLIWPSSPDDPDYAVARWQRVNDVTVLGLPDEDLVPESELRWPAIDTEAKELWEELNAIGVPAVLLRDGAM
jgi:hypothetical protein